MANEVPINLKQDDISTSLSSLQNNKLLQSMAITLEKMDEAVMIIDKTWKVKFVNSSACEKFDMDKESVIGSEFWSHFPKDVKDDFYDSYKKAIEESQQIEFNEYYAPLQSWFHVQAYPTDEGVTIIFRDTTKKQVAVQVMEQVYRVLFDEYPDAVCSIDLEGRFLSVNSSFKELFQIDEKEILGKKFIPFLPEEKQAIAQEVWECTINGRPKAIELNFTEDVGYPFSVFVTAIPIIVNNHNIGTYGIIKDITKEQMNLEEVHRLYYINQLIMESVEDGVFGLDRDLNVVMWNEAAERMTGYKKEDLTPQKLSELLKHFSSCDVDLLKKGLSKDSKLTKDTVIRRSEATFYRKNGNPFLSEYTITPMVSKKRVIGSVLTFRDITEKKKSEEMLRQSEKLSAVGQLAAGIAHEIRNPLTSLKGFLQLIEINEGGKKEYYEIMKSEFRRIEQILNELLILSKPQTKKAVSISLHTLIDHTITLLNTQAIIKNIEIVANYPTEDAQIRCVEHQIKQVFINIIKNAIEAMDNGGKITVSFKKIDKKAIIEIVDEGCGIPPDTIDRLGNPFFTTKESGTGLGLMVTFQIIEEHGGKVEIDSIQGAGSTFTITLPAE